MNNSHNYENTVKKRILEHTLPTTDYKKIHIAHYYTIMKNIKILVPQKKYNF